MHAAAKQNVIIFGAGASRADIVDIISAINAASGREVYRCCGYLDDNSALWGTSHKGVQVLGGIESARKQPDALFVNAIGSAKNFRMKMKVLQCAGIGPERYVTLIHPQATCSPTAKLGRGCVLMPGARVSSNAILGDGVILMHNAFVGHDTQVGHHTYFAPGAMSAGFNSIESCCYLGMQSSLRENITVGQGSLIGMGAVVLDNVEEDTVMVGNPARMLKRFDDPIVPALSNWPDEFTKTPA